MDLHYNGFCNSVLWALFHYVPLNIETKLSETRTLQFQWAAYQDANRHVRPQILCAALRCLRGQLHIAGAIPVANYGMSSMPSVRGCLTTVRPSCAHCRKFAEAVFDIYREGDVVWAQDYHLMLLPAMLKKQHPKMKVAMPPDNLTP